MSSNKPEPQKQKPEQEQEQNKPGQAPGQRGEYQGGQEKKQQEQGNPNRPKQ